MGIGTENPVEKYLEHGSATEEFPENIWGLAEVQKYMNSDDF